MSAEVVRLLEEDPDLGEDLAGDRAERAAQIRVATMTLSSVGYWAQPRWPATMRTGLGLLVLDGLLLRRLYVDGRFGGELLGRADLLRPWQREELASVSRSSAWRVLEPVRIALLDVELAMRIAPYPEINGRLLGRAIARSRNLAVNLAIVHQPRVDARLAVLLWHLADRWGRVRSDGVHLPLRLTHAVLGELVAARRPTVTAALRNLEERGEIRCLESGWLLLGGPPQELAPIASTPSAAAPPAPASEDLPLAGAER